MRERILLLLIVLGILDVVSILVPVTALLLIYILYARPPWFKQCVLEIYGGGDAANP